MRDEGLPRRRGPYLLEALLGRGGMAEVFRALAVEGPRAGTRVALKHVRPERAHDAQAQELLLHEADLARCLQHPHIVRFVEYGEDAEGPFLALELVEGTDLGRLLAECRRRRIELPMDLSLLIVRRVLEALEHAHHATSSTGRPLALVHGDVSPHNVLVSHAGEVKLADFGVAWTRRGPATDARRLGKQHYRSPELLAGEVSPAADLWATAVMLYELLSLEYPFPDGPPDGVDAAIRAGRVTPVRMVAPEVSDALALVLDRALAPSPAQRFSSAAQFARALAPLYDERVATPLAVAAVVRGLLGTAPPSPDADSRP
ncbi:serine/threonine-protein kinase [Myxococcaceae bacterium GXIMD 01537]